MLRPLAVQAVNALFAVGAAYGQLIIAFVAVLNDATYGLMGSLDVGDESRRSIVGVGLNASACFELCHRRTLAA